MIIDVESTHFTSKHMESITAKNFWNTRGRQTPSNGSVVARSTLSRGSAVALCFYSSDVV